MMRKTLLGLAIALGTNSLPAKAQDNATTVYLQVVLSEDMLFRAENTPKQDLESRHDKFASDGDYGMSEVEKLVKMLTEEITEEFEDENWEFVSNFEDGPDYVFQALIVDARNNRPTNHQRAGNGYKVGGATVYGKLSLVANENEHKAFSFQYYDNGNGQLTWSGAHRAFARFSDKVMKEITAPDFTLDGHVVVFD